LQYRQHLQNGSKDVLYAILGIDDNKTAELESQLKRPFNGLPLCGECDLIYVHITSLVVHLKTIQEKINDLSKRVVEKVVKSEKEGKDYMFLGGNGDTVNAASKLISDNCRRVRKVLGSKSKKDLGSSEGEEQTNKIHPYKACCCRFDNVILSASSQGCFAQQGPSQPLNIQVKVREPRLSSRPQETTEEAAVGIRIKPLASLVEVDTSHSTVEQDSSSDCYGSFGG